MGEMKETAKGFGQESLLPQDERIMGKISYVFAWNAGCITIGAFMMGASLVPPTGELNLIQGAVAMLIGITIIAIALSLNGEPGHKYGIPFIVQARSVFGFSGSKLPGFIRAVPAIFWYGVQSWIGASAVNSISIKLIGIDNIVLYFVLFQILQIALSALGFKGIKWLENIGSVFIILALGYMFYIIYTSYSTEIVRNLIEYPGTWGFAFIVGIVSFSGTYSTFCISVSDISRELTKSTKSSFMHVLHWIGTVPATMFMALIGLLVAGATGSWDPIKLFTELIPNPFVLIVTLFFIAIAQITTNVLNNVVPPAYVMMDVFKISYKKAVVIIGILAMCTFPWRIASEGAFVLFVQIYSAFLGPVFAVMVTDYFLIRKRKLDLNLLYDSEGPYQGINWQAIIAICVGAAVSAIRVELGWFLSMIPTFLAYYLLMKYKPISKGFLVGTIFDKGNKFAS